MANKTYDILKIIALIVLPAAVTCWIAIGNIWGLPYVEEIAGTVTAVATFLGALLKISSDRYGLLEDEADSMGRGDEYELQAEEEDDAE